MARNTLERQPDVKAYITLTKTKPVGSGYRPAHLIGDYLTSGMHMYIGTDILNSNETAEGYITFFTPEYYPHSLRPGMKLTFQEGSRVTGYAEIIEIYNEVLKA